MSSENRKPSHLPIIRGRGAQSNPPNRFERLHVEDDFEQLEHDPELVEQLRKHPTQYLIDASKSIISSNDSPDIPYNFTVNPYRGCSHGCIYCYARPTHEYLGFSSGLDFETRILVKMDAPELLRKELSSPKWKPEPIAMAGVTDCYQPVERRLQITRRCLEVFAEFRNPLWITTKNHLVTRDIDILTKLAEVRGISVQLSITTLDQELAQVMEPRTSVPRLRLEAVTRLRQAGIPVGILVAPVIPGLNDHEIPQILAAARDAGAGYAYMQMLRLPFAIKELFVNWLRAHYPDRAEKVIGRIKDMHGGKLNSSEFGKRMTGEGIWAEQIGQLFRHGRERVGLAEHAPRLATEYFRPRTRPGEQMELFQMW